MKYYFIGINGIGMSALAEMMVSQGAKVKGSDSSPSVNFSFFNNLGIEVHSQQSKENIPDNSWKIIISSAIKPNNEELIQAKAIGCQIIKRGQLLAQLMAQAKHQVGVMGTHGKTTTTSLIVSIFQQFSNPSYFVGGHFNGKPHAIFSELDWFITELDESDGSFLEMSPSNSVITNIEHEHIDFYPTKEEMVSAFEASISETLSKDGVCAINLDDPISEKIYKKYNSKDKFITYGIESKNAQIQAQNIEYDWQGISFKLIINSTEADCVRIHLFGRHNVYNALAAAAIAIHNQIPLKDILNGLSTFNGVKRRLELKYKANDIMLYDDYAHHPTEIITTLEGVYKSFSNHRIITIFQPHRFSRLSNLFQQFAESFDRSSHSIIVPVFSAGEDEEGYKNSQDLVKEIKQYQDDVIYASSFDIVLEELNRIIQPKDIIILMGAGSITKLANNIIPLIKSGR